MLTVDEFDKLMNEIFTMKRKPEHINVVLRFKRDVEMRWRGQTNSRHYFGECSATTNLPHGRGVLFGGNSIRVGYFTNGALSDGEVFYIITTRNGIEIGVGTDQIDNNGDTIFEGKSHRPGKKGGPEGCWVSKWINNKIA